MSHDYQTVQWTPFKKRYDRWVLGGVALYLVIFIAVSLSLGGDTASLNPVQVIIRATGSLAFILLTFVLSIGPMARISDRFKPLLYNRRHLGVTTFLLGFVHAGLVVFWYHGFGDLNPFVSVLVSNPRYDAVGGFPFESLGLVALIILYLMAATSHDFWNANLGPTVWKSLHLCVYLAYELLVLHVALGVLQFEKSPVYVWLLIAGVATLSALHLFTGLRAFRGFRKTADPWQVVGDASTLREGKAVIVRPKTGEAIAVFRHDNQVFAVSHVCRHQGGPLGEGRVVDGCITCPWHGFQYQLIDGRSPAPFTERIATYRTKLEGTVVLVNTHPSPPGTAQQPTALPESL